MKRRPPIVTILGHVDHGKTTLLDYIRKTSVAEKEVGGITQAIGAYEIEHSYGEPGEKRKITFIDTPGHEAFSKMRSHGAKVADIAVLVVAAEDGVKPQTEDAISHIKKAGIPLIVAINKIDLPNADIEKTKQDLIKAGVYLEGMGGDVSYKEISAKKGEGVDNLLDLINLAADMEDISYDPSAEGEGIVLTSFKDPRRGFVMGGIVKNGSVKEGDPITTDTAGGKIRSMENFLGQKVKKLEPSSPLLIVGFNNLPKVGEKWLVEEKDAKPVKKKLAPAVGKSEKGDSLSVLVKASETGSLEVLEDIISKISLESPVNIVGSGVGDVHEGDAKKAFSSNAFIVGFNVKVDKPALNLAKTQGVEIITSSIIYDLEDKVRNYVEKFAKKEERIIEILAAFSSKGKRRVIGGKVIQGFVNNQEEFKVFDGENEIGSGKIINLQSQKTDINRADEGQEVGLLVESNIEIKEGNRLIFYSE